MVFADTSFLISLYGQDVNTAAAKQQVNAYGRPIHVTVINEFEFANALRLLVFRGKITSASRCAQILAYEADKSAGNVVYNPCDTGGIFLRAESISATHTETSGHRAYDILHVSAALRLGATEFWSFDVKQRSLAQAEGLRVGP